MRLGVVQVMRPGRARPKGQSRTTIGEDFRLISNRQGGRRRGRGGGGRAPNINPNAGNRQDNRQRGNAAQLLEKYRGLARDTQMQGDRVQTEYYLQFADHYFRVLNESRARFEEQRRQRGEGYEGSDEDEDQLEQGAEQGGRDQGDEEEGREVEERRADRADRGRDERFQGNGEFRNRRPRGRRYEQEADDRGGAEERNADERGGDEERPEERIAIDSLPPAIAPTGDEGEEAPRAPRRRTRRPRDPGEEIAPAA